MIRVLLVEDDKNLCFILKSSLEQMIGGYEVTTAPNGREGLVLLEQKEFDVIVSDVEMPVMDGMTMVQHIRRRHPRLAIIFITGLTTARDVINGYQSGADFYIKKPFLPEELDAHIQAVLKIKSTPAPQAEEATAEEGYAIGSYRFLPSQHQLCRRKGQVVRRDDLLTAVWETADFYSSRSLDVFITKLRKYLSQDPAVTLKSLKGVGVCLED